jgi:hypothetical protein
MLKRVYKRAPKRKTIPRGCIDVSGSLAVMTQRTVQRRSLKRNHGVAFDVDVFQVGARTRSLRSSGCRCAAPGGAYPARGLCALVTRAGRVHARSALDVSRGFRGAC